MAIHKSILGIVSGLTLGLAAFAAQPAAAAEVGECSMMLADAQEARSSLDALTEAMDQGTADRSEWVERMHEIDLELAARISEKNQTTQALQTERAELVEEIRVLDTLHPKLTAQAEALGEIVERTERAYIACIEATI